MQEGVGGKAAIVKKGQNCLICLHPGHGADKCFDKDNAKRICGIEGCASHHHPTLHGAKDPAVVNCSIARVEVKQGPFSRFAESQPGKKFRKVTKKVNCNYGADLDEKAWQQ